MSIVVFDEHHEVMIYWESIRAIMPRTVLHVDFHADMWAPGKAINYQYAKTPGYLKTSVYNDNVYELLNKDITPTSFLIPSVLRYGINKIIFLKPTGTCELSKKITIGTLGGEGKIIRSVDEHNKDFFPDANTFEYIETNSLENIEIGDYVLDIDMDYFSCNMNPERYMSTFVKYSRKVLDEINKYNLSRDDYGIDLRLVDFENYGSYLVPQPDFLIRYNDDMEWIRYSIERFVSQLPGKPKYISLCRSEKLGYTPTKYVRFIEKYLKEQLCKSSISVIYPMDAPLELTVFTIIKGRHIYNFCTEVNLELDDMGEFIVNIIKERKTTTRKIVTAISETFDVPIDMILKDIQDYILELRRLLIIK